MSSPATSFTPTPSSPSLSQPDPTKAVPKSYLRRAVVPVLLESELNRSTSLSSVPTRPPYSQHYRTASAYKTFQTQSTGAVPLAGPSATKIQHELMPDPPSPLFNSAPSYPPVPPPVPPRANRAAASTSLTRARPQPPKVLSKREAYIANKERLAVAAAAAEDDEDGLVEVGSYGLYSSSTELKGLVVANLSTTTTWDISEETKLLDLPRSIIHPPRLDPKIVEPFTVHGIPSPKLIWSAGMCEVLDEMGHSVKFRDLISKDPKRRTLVFFVRHIFCGQCQDYVNNSIPELDPVALKAANVDVLIISNGHWQVIKKYRELFNCPFPMFVDGPRILYNYLGMTLLNNDFGPLKQAARSRYNVKTVPGQLVSGIGNGLFRMPLRHPGKLTQLGGEFVFGPASTIHFAHRMQHTSDHWEAVDVAEKAGVDPDSHFSTKLSLSHPVNHLVTSSSKKKLSPAQSLVFAQLAESEAAAAARAKEEAAWEHDWEQRREAELDRIRRKKLERRAAGGRPRDEGGKREGFTRGWSGEGSESPTSSPLPTRDPGQMMTREEFEREMMERQRDLEWEREEEHEANRAWTDQEQEDALAQAMSCARVEVEAEVEEYDEEGDEEQQFVSYMDSPPGQPLRRSEDHRRTTKAPTRSLPRPEDEGKTSRAW